MDGLSVSALYAGLHFSLNSTADPVVAYISVNVGIDADTWNQAYILAGVGADLNLTKRFVLFVEVTPTFPTPPSTLGWIPIRAGVRFLVPS